jgi:hypothetical protein
MRTNGDDLADWFARLFHFFCSWQYNADCSKRWCRKCGRAQHTCWDDFGTKRWYDTYEPRG